VNTTAAAMLLRPGRRCAFVSACIHHCQSMFMCNGEGASRWSALSIRGTTLRETFGNFFFNRSGLTALFGDVPYPGNSICPNWDC
jgi:hypothetical protein